jgi:DnaK suppressor protein
MVMLSTQERNKLREVLTAEKQRLLRNAQEGLSFAMNRERTIGRDSIDESMEEELFSTELRLRDREKWLLLKINAAIDRLAANTIDECEDCGETIDYRRLVARPMTTMCIDCKEEREREEQAQSMAMRGTAGESTGLGGESTGPADESTQADD